MKVNDQWRLGLGIRKATGAKFSSSGVANSLGDPKLGSKAGPLLQLDYLIGNATVSFRYVSEKYTLQGVRGSSSGNHGGLYAGYRF